MKLIYAIRKSDNVCVGNITSTNMLNEDTEYRFLHDMDFPVLHESGAPQCKLDVQGKTLNLMSDEEIKAQPEYKAWWNAKIESQLERLDIKRIRPSAEINDYDTSAQDKTAAKSTLKTLNAQAAALRKQLIK